MGDGGDARSRSEAEIRRRSEVMAASRLLLGREVERPTPHPEAEGGLSAGPDASVT